MTTISINEIESTKAWKNLNAIQKQFAVKRQNRLLIQNALIVYKNSGVIPGNVFGYNLSIIKEIIGESEKLFLAEKWKGKERQLYEKVKDLENKQVKFKNAKDRIDHRTVQFQCGVDFLGFPIYVIHEAVFHTDIDNKYPVAKNVTNQRFLNSRQYTVKQH